jgi:hypothetical protein
MATGTPSTDPRARAAPLLVGLAWLFGIRALLLLLGGFIGSSPLAEAVLGALVCDLATSRAGIAWTTAELTRRELQLTSLRAAGLAALPVLGAITFALALSQATIRGGSPNVMILASLAASFTTAIRDELLYRALPFRFAREAGLPDGAIVAFTALLSPTAFVGIGFSLPALVLSLASGLFFAVVYARASGAWAAIAAHGTTLALMGPLSRGGIVDVAYARGDLAEGAAAGGPVAFVAAAGFVAAAAWLWRRPAAQTARRTTQSSSSGAA